MKSFENQCPNEAKILEYVCDKLEFEEKFHIENHLYSCDICIDAVRKLSFASDLCLCVKANKAQGALWNKYNSDVIVFAAAASETEIGISEINSINGNYVLRLIPFIDENKSILEIQSTDSSANGILVCENDKGLLFKAPLVDGILREEISNDIDLKYLIITIEAPE